MEHELIQLFLLVCDFYDKHPVLKEQRLSNNSKPAFSDQELLTMYIFGHLQSFNQQQMVKTTPFFVKNGDVTRLILQ